MWWDLNWCTCTCTCTCTKVQKQPTINIINIWKYVRRFPAIFMPVYVLKSSENNEATKHQNNQWKTSNLYFMQNMKNHYTLRKNVLFFVRSQVQYRKSVKNVTFSSTNHDFFLKKDLFFSNKEHFWFQKKNIFSTITVLDLNLFFFCVYVLREYK
jgi:hypothetical protein